MKFERVGGKPSFKQRDFSTERGKEDFTQKVLTKG